MRKKYERKLDDGKFTENEMNVIYEFCDFGNRRESYRKYIKDNKTDSGIYKWFKRKDVQEKILEIGNDLSIYDTVSDKTLLNIITSNSANDRDKISAIKVWNDLRKRVFQTIKVEAATSIDFTNISDENLEKVVEKILEIDKENGIK